VLAPDAEKVGSLTEPRAFNLMFKTYVGATATEDDVAYLRPETAQGMFVQFKNVVDTTRVKVPFGIAQTGKAFRNEVTPRNFTFRSREFEQMEGERYLPHVIEPSAGLDRGVLAILCEAYKEDPSRASPEMLLLHPRIAPIKAAVFPLVQKEGMPEIAANLHRELAGRFARHGFIEHDPKQAIGKRYARMDEAGCPYCFTVDGETVTHQTVTVRDRDTGAQERIAIDRVSGFLAEKLGLAG
jgi:glycyl-tRNA synthetase (class II)